MSYIRLVNVTKRFGNVTAVDNLNLEIAKGECFSMLGPSGCGKTTTLRMVAGFEDLDDGEIHVGERLLSSRRTNHYTPPENRDFGMVFQAFAVWPHLSVYENVAFPLRLRKLPAAEIENRTRDALRHTNLLDVAADSPSDLSGGGKQRVALARALAIQPDVMLLDEPLSSLDPHLREEMRFEIKDLQRHYGFSILYVTHDQSEAMALSDRIMVMKLGVVQQVGTPLEVLHATGQQIRVQLHRAVELHRHRHWRERFLARRHCHSAQRGRNTVARQAARRHAGDVGVAPVGDRFRQ
ncbi:MAG: ABC transporter ATP-binding protein [Rhodocyclaceae bacterium]